MFEIFHVTAHRARLLLTTLLLSGFIIGCGKKELTAEEALTEAGTVRATGRLGESIALLENYEQAHPGNIGIIEALAFDYMTAGDPATAAMYFARVAEIDSSQAEYLIWAAEAWMTAGDPETAIAIYQQYLTVRPSDQTTRLTLAELYNAQGQSDAARDALLRINRDQPSSSVQVRIARLFLQGKNLAQAQQWFDSAARLGGDGRDDALLGLVEVAVRANRFADAEQLVVVLDREYPEALKNSPLADIRRQLKSWRATQKAAVEAATQISATPPKKQSATPTAQTNTAAPASRTSPPPTSTGPKPATPQPSPQPRATESELAETAVPSEEAHQPDKDEMITAAEHAYEGFIAPASTPAIIEQASTTIESSGPRALFPAAANNPGTTITAPTSQNYAGLLATARAAAANRRQAEAVKNFQRALARSTEDPQVWSELSESQYLLGEVHMALASASEAVRRAPTNAGYRLQYLRALQGSASPIEMIEQMERARRDFPLNASFTLVLARAHRDLGNGRFARRYFEEFIRIAPPNHPDLPSAERELRSL